MAQDHLPLGTDVILYVIDGNNELPYANAKIVNSADIKLNPATCTMQARWANMQLWKQCSAEQVKKIITNEGFLHTDDFWHSMWTNKVFEVKQFYFDITRQLQTTVK